MAAVACGDTLFQVIENTKFDPSLGVDLEAGFELGIIGMYQGGQRKLVIPRELGYVEREQTAEISAGSILIFDVTVDSVFAVEARN